MTVSERVIKTVKAENWNDTNAPAEIDDVIRYAYYLGRESSTKKISDKYNELIVEQRKRANACRYKHLANKIIGDRDYIYSADYSGKYSDIFGSDETEA